MEMDMECAEVLPDHINNEDEEEEELAPAAPSPVAPAEENDDEEEESTEDDNDDEEDTDSEPEERTVSSTASSGIRIKLKLPPKPPVPTPPPRAQATASASTAASKPLAITAPTRATTASDSSPQHNDEVVVSVGGNKPKPNLPLKRVSPAGFLKRLPVSSRGDNDTSSVGGSSAGKPKSRMRSLKLPLSKKTKEGESPVAEVVASGVASIATTTSRTTPSGGTYSKRRTMHPSKPVKLPPIFSPGLKVTSSSSSGGKSLSFTTAQLFEQTMEAAGYTKKSRTERPHRGSSIKRTVGDLFDSNVKMTMHFPALVPSDFWRQCSTLKEEKDDDGDVVMGSTSDDNNDKSKYSADDLLEQLRQTLRPSSKPSKMGMSFDEMLPISLTAPLPESYIEERLEYVKAVEERERAIRMKQEAEQEAEFNGTDVPSGLEVPPIPQPPEPPLFQQVNPTTTATDRHPLYPPKQANLATHLDPEAFHITEGRYFGLLSNNIADPNFCGPNALGVTAGSTLASAGSSSTGTPLTLSSVLFSSHPPALATVAAAASANQTGSNAGASGNMATGASSSAAATNSTASAAEISPERSESSPVTAVAVASSVEPSSTDVLVTATVEEVKPNVATSTPKDKKNGPQPTVSSSALRKIMAEDGVAAQDMRRVIIRAAVYASRTKGHGQPFVAPTGEVFPDIGKAFAAYAGIKPCERCKSNKQGSYHCRLRRKHQDMDFDGGSSFTGLKDLLIAPIESLAPTVAVKAEK